MSRHHLCTRIAAIVGTAAALTFAAGHVAPAGAASGDLETIEVNASANLPAVRITTTTTKPATTPKLPLVPAVLTPLQCGAPLGNFGASRDGGSRVHEGEDIITPRSTPVLAVVAGTLYREVKDSPGSLSGNALYLKDDATGAYYFYAHLDRTAGLPIPAKVAAGDVIGYAGDTGNPAAGSYQLHFEVHPKGNGDVVNPKPYLAVTACPKA